MKPAPPPAMRLRLITCALFLLTTIFAACGVAIDAPIETATPPPATIAPVPTATPDTVLLQDGGIAIILAAYDRLLDEYIKPIDPSRILDGAWTLLAVRAEDDGLDLPEKPAFSDDREADFGLFRTAYVALAGQSADPTQLRYASIRGMAEALQDCHTFFLSPVAAVTIEDQREGKGVVGIGVDLAGIPPLVTEVIIAGPAERAGMRVGDRIIAVDGEEISGLGPAGAFERINGKENTKVALSLERPGETTVVEVTAIRERVNPPNIETRLIEGAIGYLRIRNFVDGGIEVSLRQTFDAFESQGVTSWIIDVRGNPGGRLDVGAISLFVPSGPIVVDRNRAGEINEDAASGLALNAIRPTVLLVNNRTGSVAEVFAAALKEYGVAYVIGANTNGCVGYTDKRDLGDGTALAVTTHVNLGPVSGEVLAGLGVAPDETVARTAEDIAALTDPQLDAAIAHLIAITEDLPAP